MENLFRPGKWLVLFCGVFVLLWGVLQFVSNSRLKQEAEVVGKGLYTWSWPGDNWRSTADITDATVTQKTDHDAVVEIKGKQTLAYYPQASSATLIPASKDGPSQFIIAGKPDQTETVDFSATLTFYRMSEQNKDYWVLGKVDFPKD